MATTDSPIKPNNTSMPQPLSPIKKKRRLPQKPYVGSKRFIVNGLVDAKYSFYVSHKEWNDKKLKPAIAAKQYFILIAPSQSGKTTRILEFCEELKKGEQYFPIFIDMTFVKSEIRAGNFETESQLRDIFWKSFIDALNKELSPKNCFDHTKTKFLGEVFDKENSQKFKNLEPVLFLDEIDKFILLDNHGEMGKNVRQAFLDEIRALKQLGIKSPEKANLQSCIGITNHLGTYLDAGIGSPFNVSSPFDANYFSQEQTSELWDQYEKQESVVVPEYVKHDIFSRTNGAPGQFVMLAAVYHELINSNDDEQSIIANWMDYTANHLWEDLLKSENFKKMKKQLDEPDMKEKLCKWVLNRLSLDDKAIQKLIACNIVKEVALQYVEKFATPVVRQFVSWVYNKSQNRKPLRVMPFKGNRIDFIELLKATLTNLNRYDIILGNDKKLNKTLATHSPAKKEAIYANAFVKALAPAIPTFQYNITAECDSCFGKQKKYLDHLLEFSQMQTKIGVEHCANNGLSTNWTQENVENGLTLINHVDKAYKHYMAHNKKKKDDADFQMFILHWTNVPPEKLPDSKYTFPVHPEIEKKGSNFQNPIRIVHIYHDDVVDNLMIVTENERIKIEFDDSIEKMLESQKKEEEKNNEEEKEKENKFLIQNWTNKDCHKFFSNFDENQVKVCSKIADLILKEEYTGMDVVGFTKEQLTEEGLRQGPIQAFFRALKSKIPTKEQLELQ